MSKKDIDAYLAEYKSVIQQEPEFWQNHIPMRPDLAENQTFHRKQAALINEEAILEEIIDEIQGKDDIEAHQALIGILGRQLYTELETLMTQEEKALYDSIRLTFLPLNIINALCFSSTRDTKVPLNGNIVVLNEGLYYSIMLLVKGYLFELANGDLAPYHRNGSQDYHDAILFFTTKSQEYASRYSLSGIDNPEHHAELSINQSLIAMMIIKFIALHEVGHIYHGDLTQNYALELSMVNFDTPDHIKQAHEKEFQADQYALKKICNLASTEQGKWSNFFAVYLFFLWLSGVYKRQKTRLDTHPSPEKRAERLLSFMTSYVGNEQQYQPQLEWITGMVEDWEQTISSTAC